MRKQIDNVNHQDSAPPADVLESLHALMHQLRGLQLRGAREDHAEVSPMEGKALGFFARHPGATQRDLAEHTGRDKGQLARLVGSLRDKGLLEARPDEQDRRIVRLHPSAAAQAMHRQVMAQRQALAARALAALSPAEQHQLQTLIDKLQAGLTEGG